MSGGSAFSCGLTSSGAAYCWGSGTFGQLGDGAKSDRHTPVAVSGGLTFASLSAGAYYACGLTNAGAAYLLGIQLLRSARRRRHHQHDHPGGSGWRAHLRERVRRGLQHRWTHDGRDGVLLGRRVQSTHPCGHPGRARLHQRVGARRQRLWRDEQRRRVLLGRQYLRHVGRRSPGLGGGDYAGSRTGRPVVCECGRGLLSRLRPHARWCGVLLGQRQRRRVGHGDDAHPLCVFGEPVPVQHHAGARGRGDRVHELDRRREQHLRADERREGVLLGSNASGKLGDGTTTNRATPVAVAPWLTFASLEAGGTHTCGVSTIGVAYCWGLNGAGRLGNGTTSSASLPVVVTSP